MQNDQHAMLNDIGTMDPACEMISFEPEARNPSLYDAHPNLLQQLKQKTTPTQLEINSIQLDHCGYFKTLQTHSSCKNCENTPLLLLPQATFPPSRSRNVSLLNKQLTINSFKPEVYKTYFNSTSSITSPILSKSSDSNVGDILIPDTKDEPNEIESSELIKEELEFSKLKEELFTDNENQIKQEQVDSDQSQNFVFDQGSQEIKEEMQSMISKNECSPEIENNVKKESDIKNLMISSSNSIAKISSDIKIDQQELQVIDKVDQMNALERGNPVSASETMKKYTDGRSPPEKELMDNAEKTLEKVTCTTEKNCYPNQCSIPGGNHPMVVSSKKQIHLRPPTVATVISTSRDGDSSFSRKQMDLSCRNITISKKKNIYAAPRDLKRKPLKNMNTQIYTTLQSSSFPTFESKAASQFKKIMESFENKTISLEKESKQKVTDMKENEYSATSVGENILQYKDNGSTFKKENLAIYCNNDHSFQKNYSIQDKSMIINNNGNNVNNQNLENNCNITDGLNLNISTDSNEYYHYKRYSQEIVKGPKQVDNNYSIHEKLRKEYASSKYKEVSNIAQDSDNIPNMHTNQKASVIQMVANNRLWSKCQRFSVEKQSFKIISSLWKKHVCTQTLLHMATSENKAPLYLEVGHGNLDFLNEPTCWTQYGKIVSKNIATQVSDMKPTPMPKKSDKKVLCQNSSPTDMDEINIRHVGTQTLWP